MHVAQVMEPKKRTKDLTGGNQQVSNNEQVKLTCYCGYDLIDSLKTNLFILPTGLTRW